MRKFIRQQSIAILMMALALPSVAAPVRAPTMMISAANPLAAAAGLEILQQGGSAIDAAIAAQMVLNVVEPQSSGIGGGAFLLFWDEKSKTLHAFDGRETAPAAADENLFAPDGEKMPWRKAVVGGRAVGAPGLLAMLELAHKQHGKLSWETLFTPAIKIAKEGFVVSPRLSESIANEAKVGGLGRFAAAKDYFFDKDGNPLSSGVLLKNAPLADTFRRIAAEGTSAFYRGDIARDIVAAVQNNDNAGMLSEEDLQQYRAKKREPLCADYREHQICGMPPPTSGGLTVLQILKTLENFDLSSLPPLSHEAAHLFTQAAKLSYADRAVHIADPDFHSTPTAAMLDESYLKSRATLIDKQKDMGKATTGLTKETVAQINRALPSTTHLSIVDKDGNALSMTSSIENAFGSTILVRGFLLNNQLTDFSFAAKDENANLIANRVQAGKRPRSSMSPMIIFDKDGELELVIGSPGGSRIINYVARAIIAILDWGLDVQSALDLPHYVNRNGVTDLEEGTAAENLQEALSDLGHEIKIRTLTSGLHGIHHINGELQGGADPRREGVAVGL